MHFLVTAGPTREPIDPVRYISNRSSGKMGYAIAEAAVAAGHVTTLVSGPVSLPTPPGLQRLVRVETAAEMLAAVREAFGIADVLVMCAAVADFRPVRREPHKLKKAGRTEMMLTLEPTVDILRALREQPPTAEGRGRRPLVVGFAAETRGLDESARGKLETKGCDLIVGNDVSRAGVGFDGDDNEVVLYFRNGTSKALPRASKRTLGTMLVEIIAILEKKG